MRVHDGRPGEAFSAVVFEKITGVRFPVKPSTDDSIKIKPTYGLAATAITVYKRFSKTHLFLINFSDNAKVWLDFPSNLAILSLLRKMYIDKMIIFLLKQHLN